MLRLLFFLLLILSLAYDEDVERHLTYNPIPLTDVSFVELQCEPVVGEEMVCGI